MVTDPDPRGQPVLVLAGTHAVFEQYLRDHWGVSPHPDYRTALAGRFRFVRVHEPEDALGYDHQTPYLLLHGWTELPLPVLKAVLDRYETRFR